MSNIIVRFSIYSFKDKEEIAESVKDLISTIPTANSFYWKGENVLNNRGEKTNNLYKETSFDYEYKFENVNRIEICYSFWLNTWASKIEVLKIAKGSGFNSSLNFEITIFENNYPELYFEPEFLFALAKGEINLSFYFYND